MLVDNGIQKKHCPPFRSPSFLVLALLSYTTLKHQYDRVWRKMEESKRDLDDVATRMVDG